VLLVVSGVAKLRNPVPTSRAARAIGLPAPPAAVRTLGLVEIAAGAIALVAGRGAALVVAALYLFLAGIALALRLRAPATPCGCLGAASAPASWTHVVLNVVGALCALTAVGSDSALARLADEPIAGIVLLVLALCTARLAVLAIDAQEAPL
jgi:hypothetical protein